MEPTSANQAPGTPLSRWGEPLASALWSGLVIAVLLAASERLAGTLAPSRSVFGAISAAAFAWLLGTAAAMLVLVGRTEKAPHSVRIRWHQDRVPTVGMSVIPPLLLGLLLLPDDSSAWAASLSLFSAVPAGLLMSDRWARWWPHRMTGDDLAEIIADALPASEIHSTPVSVAEPTRPAESTSAAVPLAAEPGGIAPSVIIPALASGPLSVFDPGEHESEEEFESPNTVFQLARRIDESTENSASGTFRVDLPAGRRQANFHIPFVPAFDSAPEVECELVDGDESVRIKVGVSLPWGARIEIRRSESEESASATVAFHAAARSEARAA